MTTLAGAIHLWIVPEHWEHAPAHGLLVLIAGIAQIVWGIAVWRKPSTMLYYVGILMAGWLIVLYAITRFLPAPFGHGGPEAIDAIGLVCKLCEGLGMLSLTVLIFHGIVLKAGRVAAWRAIASILLFSFITGFVTYNMAHAAEPIFPGLSGLTEEHHDHEIKSAPEVEHNEDH